MSYSPAQRIHDELDAISRTRALTNAESLRLEQAIAFLDADKKPGRPPLWTPEDDATFFEAVANGASIAEAGRLVGKTRGAAAGRFKRISETYGWQAQ